MRLKTALSSLLLLAACAASRVPTPTAPPATPVGLPLELHWMRNSAEYRATVYQTYAAATRRLEELVASVRGSWAVALDGDETVIDNLDYQKRLVEQGKTHNPEDWRAWCREGRARALPGVIPFLERVRRLGGKIAIVSNRDREVLEPTEANFRAQGIPFDVMLLREGDSQKEGRWQKLRDGTAAAGLGPLEIVMYVGDNIADFPGLNQSLRFESPEAWSAFGDRFWVIPNPVYGSWVENPMR